MIEFRGRTQGLRAWSRELGIPESTIRTRLRRAGLSVGDALSRPVVTAVVVVVAAVPDVVVAAAPAAVAPAADVSTPGDGRTTCKHCGRPKVNRPRGLCWSCFYRPGVRELHPSTSVYAHRGIGHRPPRKLPEPTQARGGTPEKVAVLAGRVERGECLWHPLDA